MATGATSFPAATQAAQAAAKYLNATQGGLAGKKINLVTCDMENSNQSAQACGEQFANDKNMPFAILGLTLNGGPFYEAMNAAHKPILGAIGITPADNNPTLTYFYYPGATYYVDLAQYVKTLHVHSISYIYENEAAATAGEQTVASGLKGTGITIKAVAVPPAASDVTAQVGSADIGSTDLAMFFLSGGCPQIAQAMQSLGVTPKKVIAVNTCVTPQNITESPSSYQNWLVVSPDKMSVAGAADPDVALFLKGWAQYGSGGTAGTFAELGWGVLLTAAKVFQGQSNITSASANTSLADYTGSVVMGPSSVKCPGPAPYTATCGKSLTFYSIQNGKWVPATG